MHPAEAAVRPVAELVGGWSFAQQFTFYLQFLYRFVFAYLVFLYIRRYGIAEGLLPYDAAALVAMGYILVTSCIMLLWRSLRGAGIARGALATMDLFGLAIGVPHDPHSGLPMLFLFYIAFLDYGLRYGYRLYINLVYGTLAALACMIFLRANYISIGFSLLDAWQVLLYLLVVAYGLPVFFMHQRTYDALRETKERLQLSLESPGVCTWTSDAPLEAIKPDGNLEHILGAEPGQLSGRMDEYIEMLHPDDRKRIASEYAGFVRGDTPEYDSEHRVLGKDGVWRVINVRAKARRDLQGRAISVSGMAWDLTEQRRQQEELFQLEERYRLATHSAQMGSSVYDIERARFDFDGPLGVLLGLAPSGGTHPLYVMTPSEFMAIVHPDDRKRVEEETRALVKSDANDYFQEYRIVLKSGEVRGVQTRGSVFRDARGRAIRMAGFVWDATQLMEARLALEKKSQELERTNRELDDFSYIASHDLKEPLRGIRNYAQFLEEDYAERLDDKGRMMLQKLTQQAKRMETLVQELLSVAHIGRSHLTLEDCDLQTVLVEVLASLEFSIREHNVDIRVPRPLPTMPCDRVRVGELFRNLITNGLKYNDKPSRWLEIGYNGAEAQPVFFVRDNGIGIKPEHHRQVFAMFQRLHARDAFGGGTGMGMTIAQMIVELHGGRIWFDSAVGVGTTFHFTLGKGTVQGALS